jgi:protein-disulfide isomerase
MDDSGRIGEGNEIVITEFSDFECPFCSRVVTMLDDVVKHYGPNRASMVFKNFPLSFHKKAGLAAEAVLAANAQGKFEGMYHKLFDNQKALERTDLEKYAQEIGLNLDRFKSDLDNGTFKKAVEADMALGQKVGVGGTPTIYINGRLYNGERTAEDMIKVIDQKILGKK